MKILSCLILALLISVQESGAQDPNPEYFTNRLVGLNKDEIKTLEEKARNRDASAQLLIGLLKMKTRNPARRDYQNPNEGLSLIKLAAEQNFAPAQYFIVELCQDQANEGIIGHEACKNDRVFLERAVSQNYPAAVWYRAYFYLNNKPSDCDKAIENYKKSGELGFAYGFYSVGRLYENGTCVKADEQVANKWYMKSAEAGDATAQDTLAIRISEGIGTRPNNREAVKWFKKSAEQGHVYGACNLALHYARGLGVARNPHFALKWSFVSNSLDGLKCHPDDFVEFLKIRRKGTIIRARESALGWLRKHPWLTNNFGERPWLKDGEFPITFREH
ncbi:MAG: sel1 repeat family protein [Pyrinomonadaceae bacterium]|nr:sel1 repeat family protein [Pyrinomonadaceae bacterium]